MTGIKLICDGVVYNPSKHQFDEKATQIDAWYDRHTRDYCIQLLNKEGNQVGDSIRVGTKADKNSEVKRLKEEYNL